MDKPLTPEEFARRVRERPMRGDAEGDHYDTDDMIEELLIALGYGEGVEIIRESTRWYA